MLKVQEIREIIKLVDQSNIDEFTYESEGVKVKMKKSGATIPVQKEIVTLAPEEVVSVKKEEPKTIVKEEVVETKAAPVKEEPKVEEVKVDADFEIVSPMVGTFYSAPSPEEEDYVKVGSSVQKDSVVCIVEAMKLFNEIEAEVDGEIVEVLVENGELVEYGQPLFRVKTK